MSSGLTKSTTHLPYCLVVASIFQRLERYSPREDGRDPGEDRLTEAFAFTLEAAPDLARSLGRRWLDVSDDVTLEEPVVNTQRRGAGRDRIDLEIVFAGTTGRRARVWVEVKRSSKLSGPDQLEKYGRALNDGSNAFTYQRLVFLPPADFDTSTIDVPESAYRDDWQQTGLSIRRWADTDGRNHRLQARIVREFLSYLKELNLAVTDRLGLMHAVVLEEHANTYLALKALVDRTDALVAQGAPTRENGVKAQPGIGKPTDQCDPGQRRHGLTWPSLYRVFESEASKARELPAYLEWNFWPRKTAAGQALFAAGVTASSRTPLRDQGVRSAFQDEGFAYPDEDDFARIYKYFAPAELVRAESLDEQAEILAAWILETFAVARGIAEKFGTSL